MFIMMDRNGNNSFIEITSLYNNRFILAVNKNNFFGCSNFGNQTTCTVCNRRNILIHQILFAIQLITNNQTFRKHIIIMKFKTVSSFSSQRLK